VLRDDTGSAVDLSGATARLHVRDGSGAKVAEASTADGRITISPAEGRISLIMPASAMTVPPGTYRWDLEVTWPGGDVQTIEQQSLVVMEDMTHD
jgi:hypothetical protein